MHTFVVVERRYARDAHHYCVRGAHEFTDMEYERIFQVDEMNQVHVMKFCDECKGAR